MLFNLNLTIRLVLITVFATTLISCGEDQSTRSIAPPPVTLVSPISGEDYEFSLDIQFSPDGETLAISEVLGGLTTVSAYIGVVYLYSKSNDDSGWILQTKLSSSTAMNGNDFGSALSFSPDGRYLAVGESRASYLQNTLVGNVQIFDKTNNWENIRTLLAFVPTPNDYFGAALSFSPDGKILAVAAPQQLIHERPADIQFGKVDLFDTSNGNWAYSTSVNSTTVIVGSSFGMEISFSPDSKTLAVSEMHSAKLNTPELGNVQLFSLDSNNAWIYEQTLESAIPNQGNLFGSSLSFNPIDSTLAIGEIYGESIDSFEIGAVHFYDNNAGGWEPTDSPPLLSNAPSTNAEFGSSIRYSPDGKIMAISETMAIVGGQSKAGLVHLYRKSPQWQWYQALQSDQPNIGNNFGSTIRFSPDSQTLAIGELYGDDSDKVDIGKVHIFDLNQ